MTDLWLEQFENERKDREKADRTFTVFGVELTVKPSVAPEVALTFVGLQRRILDGAIARAEAETTGKEAPALELEDTELLDISEATIRRCLEPGSLKNWQALRDPERDNPLSLTEIYRLAGYVLSRASGLPTVAPVVSSNGRTQTEASSKAGSRSRASAKKS